MVLLLLAVLTGPAFVVLRQRFESGTGMPDYSAYSRKDNGLAAAAEVLRKLGFQPIALSRPMQNTHYRGLLIVVEPQQTHDLLGWQAGLSEADSQGLLSWVSQGNTLVLVTRHWTPIHEKLHVQLMPDEAAAVNKRSYLGEALEVSGYTEPGSAADLLPVRQLGLEGQDGVRGKDGWPLWYVKEQPGAWLVPHGAGRVLFLAEPSLWTHRGLTRQDNVLFLYNVAMMDALEGRVFFDEYHHGIRSGGGYWDYLRYHNMHWIAVQLLVLLLAGWWAVGVRLGPAVPTPLASQADAVAYASAAARIYQRAGVRHLMAEHIARDFLAALTRYLHLRRSAAPREILAVWRQRYGADSAQALSALLNKASALQEPATSSDRTSRRELLHWAREFDAFVNKLQRV